MKKIFSYLLSPLYLLLFGLTCVVFHPIQVVCRWIGGYQLRKKSVDIMNFILVYGLTILGSRIRFKGFEQLPEGRPFIIISNHQSTFDIPPIVWGFRKYHPKFVSKIELGKGIPHIEKENYSASIFPEGTRTKTGDVKRFQHAGIASLLKYAPSALLVPLVIDGNHELTKNGYYPLSLGVPLTYTVLPVIDPAGHDIKELTKEIELQIKKELGL